jgi:hypothetical protein
MTQLQIGQLGGRSAGLGVGRERSDPVSVDIGIRSCAPGCGRSLRTITRIPAGHPDMSSRPASSATHAPSRISSWASRAGVHTSAGISSNKSEVLWGNGNPTEYDNR